MTLDDLRRLVRAECDGPSNRFGPAFFEQHVALVAERACALAGPLGADREVVELAAWLHDLAAVRDLACVPTHALDGARLARALLRDGGWAAPVVDAACRCIEAHSAPVSPAHASPEEVCLSNADLVAQLARPAYWFFYLHRVRGLDQAAALAWWRGRAEGAFGALGPEAQAMAAADREAILRLLQGAGEPSGGEA